MKSRLLRGLASFGAALATLGTISLQAQNTYPRLGLVEQFTSATCGPCVAAGPVMARVVQLRDNYVSIRYHMNFPAPGDPWNVLNPEENGARQSFYGVNSIPTARVNGKSEADPRNEGALTAPLIADKNAKSPAYITVVQDGGKVKVKVWSNIALNAHRLHVAMVSRSTTVPELASLPGNNGERTFGDAMLDMLTGPQGQSITIAANGTQEFEFPIQLGGGSLWPANQQYAIAFIQANANREVIQAGTMRSSQDSTQLAFIRPTAVNATIAGDVYGKVARGATTTREITFTNTSSTAVKVTPSLNDQGTLTQVGWTVSFQPSGEVTVPANGTTKVTLSLQAPANRSVFSTFNLSYVADDGAGRSILPFNILVEGARLAMYYGTSDAEPVILAAQSVLGIPSIAADAVLLPYNTQANQAYPWSSFEGAVFTFNESGLGQLGSSGAITTIKNMLAAGKKVWVSAELEMTANFNTNLQQIWNQEARDWFGTTLGVTYLGPLDFVNQNQLIRFTANGTGNSVIGNGVTVNGHAEYSANWPYYQRYVDIWSINPGSQSREQFTIPVNSQQGQINAVVGITYETSNGGKLYYSSLSMLPISTAATRNTIASNVINWMFQAPQPAVGLSAQQINFGELFVNADRTNNLTITNTGAGPLQISSVTISGADASSFEITEGAIAGSPVTVEPNSTYRIRVRFAPTTSGTKNASLVINHNASGNSNVVPMSGRATVSSVETDVTSETGAISMALRGSHPVTTQSAIELTVLNGQPVTVTVVDQTGRTVSTLAQDVTASGVFTLDAAQLAAGSYTVVATNGTERAILTVVVTR